MYQGHNIAWGLRSKDRYFISRSIVGEHPQLFHWHLLHNLHTPLEQDFADGL